MNMIRSPRLCWQAQRSCGDCTVATLPSPWLRQPENRRRHTIATRSADFEVTADQRRHWFRDIDEKFVRNAPLADVQKALAGFVSAEPTGMPTPFTPLVVNTG